MTIFTKNWEKELEAQHLDYPNAKRAYICSPLSGKTTDEILDNMHHAREYMYYVSKEFTCITSAPHAYLPVLLNDNIPTQRAIALDFGLNLLKESDYLFVCGNRISNGMKKEIEVAANLGISIFTFNSEVQREAKKILAPLPEKIVVKYMQNYPALATASPKDFLAK